MSVIPTVPLEIRLQQPLVDKIQNLADEREQPLDEFIAHLLRVAMRQYNDGDDEKDDEEM